MAFLSRRAVDASRLKVLVLTTSFPLSDDSSSGIFIKRLVEYLAQGAKVTVLTPCGPASSRRPNSDYRLACFRYAPKRWQLLAHHPGGVPAAIKRNKLLLLLVPLLLGTMFWSCLRLALRVDIIHANWSLNGVVAGLVGLISGRPVITTLRGSDVNLAQGRHVYRLMLKLCRLLNQRVVAVSKGLSSFNSHKSFQEGDQLIYIPNGVGDEFLHVARSTVLVNKERFCFTCIGNLIPLKGVDTVIRAFAKMAPAAGVTLMIVGDGPEKQRLQQLARTLGVTSQVQFKGRLAPARIPSILAQTDVAILASHSEGRPNSVLESMAAGLPVIATHIPGVQDIIEEGKTGLLCKVGDSTQLARLMDRLYSDHALRGRMGQAGRQLIISKGWTWSHAARQYLQTYQNLVCKNP